MEPLEKLKEIATGISDENILAIDDQGNVYGLQEALSKGLKVSLTSGKKRSMEEFKQAFGINLEDVKQRNLLKRILNDIEGGGTVKSVSSSGGKRQSYSDADKVDLIKKWLKEKESGISKKTFCENNGVQYATFNSWLTNDQLREEVK